MQQMYTPALEVSSQTVVSKIRELPLPGKVLVKKGDAVEAHTPVLSADLPGDIIILRIADRIGLDPEVVIGGMKVKVGDTVQKGQLLCSVKTFFGLFTAKFHSPFSGTVEFFTEANGHLGLRQESVPLVVNAYVKGTIVATEEGKSVTIETAGSYFQGIFGVGGERHGNIFALDASADAIIDVPFVQKIAGQIKDAIVVGGAQFTLDAIREVASAGGVAIVTGSIDAESLAGFVGHEIGVSITGDEEIPLTLIITEGFGQLSISNRITEIAKKLHGKFASVNGATQVRAGAMRPEVIVPIERTGQSDVSATTARTLAPGARVRMIRFPYFGIFGQIVELPHQPVEVETGASVRVFNVKTDDGQEIVVPRANVELL